MAKTRKEWFDTIKDPNIRDKAITNTNPWDLETERCSLLDSLSDAFLWEHTPEKHQYWSDFIDTLETK